MNNKLKHFVSFLCLAIFLILIIGSATERQTNFTSDNVLKLKKGMTDKEVIAIFGNPKKTEATTCGQKTDSPWSCIIWYYGEYYKPMLIFQQYDDGTLKLNSWNM